MNKRRLLKLASLLEADAKNKKGIKFDISIIAAKAKKDIYGYIPFAKGEKPKADCGTAACAIGLACVSGAFKSAGLTYDIKSGGLAPKVGRNAAFEAAYKIFGLSEGGGDFLFLPSSYKGRQAGAKGERAVAKRIRDFVAGKVAP